MTMDSPSSSVPDTVIRTSSLTWQWPGQRRSIRFPDIRLTSGQHLFIRGASGSGKTTLLSLLSGLLRPQSGTIEVHQQNLAALGGGARDRLRADRTGVIFQQFNLVPYLSSLDNVMLPCRLSPVRRRRAGDQPKTAALSLLAALGLPPETFYRKAPRLSTGQQQRVAVARALIGAPPLILADEPTSALDTDNRDRFIELLLTQARNTGCSVVFVSHDPTLARHFHQSLTLSEAGENEA